MSDDDEVKDDVKCEALETIVFNRRLSEEECQVIHEGFDPRNIEGLTYWWRADTGVIVGKGDLQPEAKLEDIRDRLQAALKPFANLKVPGEDRSYLVVTRSERERMRGTPEDFQHGDDGPLCIRRSWVLEARAALKVPGSERPGDRERGRALSQIQGSGTKGR